MAEDVSKAIFFSGFGWGWSAGRIRQMSRPAQGRIPQRSEARAGRAPVGSTLRGGDGHPQFLTM